MRGDNAAPGFVAERHDFQGALIGDESAFIVAACDEMRASFGKSVAGGPRHSFAQIAFGQFEPCFYIVRV